MEHDGATPPACTTAAFKDVPKSSAYCGAIKWMADQGLTTSKSSYAPTAAVTRGMMAAFLHRFDGR
jgi:S-layer homology domain